MKIQLVCGRSCNLIFWAWRESKFTTGSTSSGKQKFLIFNSDPEEVKATVIAFSLRGLCRHWEFEESLPQKGHIVPGYLLQHREPWGQFCSQASCSAEELHSLHLALLNDEFLVWRQFYNAQINWKGSKFRHLMLFLNWKAWLTLETVLLLSGDKPGARNPSATPLP